MQIAATKSAETTSAHIKDITTQSFPADVLEASKAQPVLVDFWAPWCGPCRQLTPVIEKLVNAAGGKVRLAKMNIDEHPAIPGQLGVQSIPTVIAFKDGRPVDAFMGALPESQIKQFIDGLISSLGGAVAGIPDLNSFLQAGEAALSREDPITAMETFTAALDVDPQNARALAGMAQASLQSGQAEQAKAILSQVPADKVNDPAVAGARAAIELAEKTADIGDITVLQEKLGSDPQNYQARFDLALAFAAKGKRQEAVDALLEILKTKRDWKDGAARTQLLQFFEAWGFDDEASVYGRKKFSSLLFS